MTPYIITHFTLTEYNGKKITLEAYDKKGGALVEHRPRKIVQETILDTFQKQCKESYFIRCELKTKPLFKR